MHQQPDTISNDTTHQSMLAFHNSPIRTRLKLKPELILYILINIFLMIVIVNCSLYNPGPDNMNDNNLNSNFSISDKLSIHYQNVQGLIPFTELNKTHPYLDNTKLCELHAYIYEKQPDIIILNETWLKSTILDGEIFPLTCIKLFGGTEQIFLIHPILKMPLNLEKNGGGVLIAVSCSLQLSCSRVNLNCKAELLAIEIILNDASKIVITNCYKVGTLGIQNCNEICHALTKLLRKKRVKKLFIIGDFNLPNVNWDTNLSSSNVVELFLEEFFRLGLIRCITESTHKKGNILDVLLTNSENFISNIQIKSNCEICKSDHYAITFDIMLKVSAKSP